MEPRTDRLSRSGPYIKENLLPPKYECRVSPFSNSKNRSTTVSRWVAVTASGLSGAPAHAGAVTTEQPPTNFTPLLSRSTHPPPSTHSSRTNEVASLQFRSPTSPAAPARESPSGNTTPCRMTVVTLYRSRPQHGVTPLSRRSFHSRHSPRIRCQIPQTRSRTPPQTQPRCLSDLSLEFRG